MNKPISLLFTAGALAALLSACGGSTDTSSSAVTPSVTLAAVATAAPAQASDANAAAPATTDATTSTDTANSAPAAPPNGGMGVMGTVTAISGNTLTVQDQRQQSTLSIALSDATQIFKQATLDLSGVSVGEAVVASGTQDGDVFTAMQIRVGDNSATPMGNGNPPQGQPPAGANDANGAPQGTPPDGQAPAGGPGGPNGQGMNRLSGTVEQVADGILTIKTADGSSVKVQLGSDASIVHSVAATVADITAGVQIRASGQQGDAAFSATRIDIVPAMTPPQ